MYEMLVGIVPYGNSSVGFHHDVFESKYCKAGPRSAELLKKMLAINPTERSDIQTVLNEIASINEMLNTEESD